MSQVGAVSFDRAGIAEHASQLASTVQVGLLPSVVQEGTGEIGGQARTGSRGGCR